VLWKFLIATVLILSLSNVNTIEVNAAEIHDIAVISVTPSPAEVEAGDLVNITVVVRNQGAETETFNLTVYNDDNVIETKTVLNLTPNENATLTFEWNTTDASTGFYTLKADVPPLPEETVTEDNTLVSPNWVRVFVSPYIAVVPGSTFDPALTPGMNYTISVYTDYNGDDVWGYEFKLTFNPNVLEGVEVVNGDLITDTTLWLPGTFNNTVGKLSLTGNAFYFLSPPTPLTSGPGTLVNITFTVVGYGDSYITLEDETRLIGYTDGGNGTAYNIIEAPLAGYVLDGYFSNKEVTHDIAVVSVTPSPTEAVVGELVNITVVIENQGTVNERVTIKVYRDYRLGLSIDTKTVQNISAGAIKSLIFAWNTTFVLAGNYTITAVTSPLPGEKNTGNNILQSDEIVSLTAREEQPLPINLIIGVAIIAVVAFSVIWYASKRRRKSIHPRAHIKQD